MPSCQQDHQTKILAKIWSIETKELKLYQWMINTRKEMIEMDYMKEVLRQNFCNITVE
jgi:hypothetical protein